jgi:predicted permease
MKDKKPTLVGFLLLMAIIIIVIFIFAIMLDLKKNRQFSTPASGVMNFRQ